MTLVYFEHVHTFFMNSFACYSPNAE